MENMGFCLYAAQLYWYDTSCQQVLASTSSGLSDSLITQDLPITRAWIVGPI